MATTLGQNTIGLNYGNNSIGGNTNASLYRLAGNNFFPFANRIINGEFNINQRNPSGAVNNTTGNFSVDRWYMSGSIATKFSAGIVADGPVVNTTYSNNWTDAPSVSYPPRSFKTCIELKSLGATTLGASDFYNFSQAIEGRHIMDMDFGNIGSGSGAGSTRYFIFSFYVKASIAGNYHIRFTNSAANRVWKSTYTVSSANTWERKALLVQIDTTGTWLNNTNVGLRVTFSLGLGSNYIGGTNGNWTAETTLGPSGSVVHLVNTSGATLRLTGIQLEYVGIGLSSGLTPQPSDFQSRPWTEEYKLCQRYYQKSYAYTTSVGNAGTAGMFIVASDLASSTVQQYNHCRWPGGALRGQPTVQPFGYYSGTSAGYGTYWRYDLNVAADAVAYTANASSSGAMFYFGSPPSHWMEGFHWVADADLG